jgi:hypothetical protein
MDPPSEMETRTKQALRRHVSYPFEGVVTPCIPPLVYFLLLHLHGCAA